MRIAIVGAGAIGGWVGTRLAQKRHDISVLARGETLKALRTGPWRLEIGGETLTANVKASDEPSELGLQDVIIIALKGPALESVAGRLAPMIGNETMIVPMMNGVPWWFALGGAGDLASSGLASVDPNGTLERELPLASVIGNVVHASTLSNGPANIVHKGGNRLIFGEPNSAETDRLRQLVALFRAAGFDAEASPRIRYEIWYKLWGNMTMNPISAITGATCDRLLDDPMVAEYVLRIMEEAKAIGDRIGCRIEERGEDRNAVTRQLGAFKTSMLQDAEAGRPLEIDQLLSAPREIAGKLGIATPNLDALLGLTRLFAKTHGLYT